jgi:hypothetical protein
LEYRLYSIFQVTGYIYTGKGKAILVEELRVPGD